MLNDFRLALRGFARSPGLAVVTIATLALGIGASTAIFSVLNGVLLRALPYPAAERLMLVSTVFSGGYTGRQVSYPNFEDLREQNGSFDSLAAYSDWTTSAAADGEGFRVAWAQVSEDFFGTLGVAPSVGRTFTAEELRAGAPVAVVSYGYWQSRLGGRPNVAGEDIRVGDTAYSVIGVMPRGYDFPSGAELWVPREPFAESRTANNWRVVGRLAPGVSETQAQADLTAVARRLKAEYGDDTPMTDAAVQPMLDTLVGPVRPALLTLFGAAGVLLLVACVNVANLLLARALARDREAAVRLALGAGPGRLARSFFIEALLLSLAGALLGVLLAYAGVPVLLALEPGYLPRVAEIAVDSRVLAFALAACVATALLISIAPALRAARRDVREALADGQRIQGGGHVERRVRGGLVVAQIALTIALLIGAGLLSRTFLALLDVDLGFRTEDSLVMETWLPVPQDEAGNVRVADFIRDLTARLRAAPGVERVGGVNVFPLKGGGADGTFVVLDRPDEIGTFDDFARVARDRARTGNAEFRVAMPGYFAAMGIPLLRGRVLDERDVRGAPHAAVISASLAESRWGDEDPLGKLIQFGNMDGDLTPFTVVGVVGDVQDYGIGTRPRPTFYADAVQRPRVAWDFHFVMQGRFDAAAVAALARRSAAELRPAAPVEIGSIEAIVSASLSDRRFVLLLIGLFGGIALVLAATGAYGVIAYMAARRTPEIGVRMALGARPSDVVRLLVRQGAVFAVAGIAVGLLAALGFARVLASLLYGVGPADPVTFMAVAAVMLVTVLLASFIPARRASRIDTLQALRHD
jgi:putative ABC transport system permease protein